MSCSVSVPRHALVPGTFGKRASEGVYTQDDPLQRATLVVDGKVRKVDAIHVFTSNDNLAGSSSLLGVANLRGSPTAGAGSGAASSAVSAAGSSAWSSEAETDGVSTVETRAIVAAINMRAFARGGEAVLFKFVLSKVSTDAQRKLKMVTSVGDLLTRAASQLAVVTLQLQGRDLSNDDRRRKSNLKAELEWVVQVIEDDEALNGDEAALKRFVELGNDAAHPDAPMQYSEDRAMQELRSVRKVADFRAVSVATDESYVRDLVARRERALEAVNGLIASGAGPK